MPEIEVETNTSTNASPGSHTVVDSLKKSLRDVVSKPRSGDTPTIYIVPQTIRQVNEVAYEPKIMSIGPYHHGKEKLPGMEGPYHHGKEKLPGMEGPYHHAKEKLQGMEEHKCWYLDSFLSRNPNRQLEDYVKAIEELEDKARSCYSENVGPGKEFVKMMVLDGCFIVELFLKLEQVKEIQKKMGKVDDDLFNVELSLKLNQKEEELNKKEELKQKKKELSHEKQKLCKVDPIFNTTWMLPVVGYDILLLENQIPFFILQRIFEMACPIDHVPLAEMVLDFYQLMPRDKEIKNEDPYHHLLHLFHSHLINDPNLSRNSTIESPVSITMIPCATELQLPLSITEPREMIPCATDLQLAGVKFKKNKKSNNILNVKFNHGVLEITPFVIDDDSDTLFRNLVAFEQCYPEVNDYFTTYIVFMDCLVNTSKDVAILHQNGIIDNLLGSDEDVTSLFNRLCIGIFHSFEESYLSDVKDKVQKQSENKRNMWRAILMRDYFSNPWTIISLIAAIILLGLAITQTVFSILH